MVTNDEKLHILQDSDLHLRFIPAPTERQGYYRSVRFVYHYKLSYCHFQGDAERLKTLSRSS